MASSCQRAFRSCVRPPRRLITGVSCRRVADGTGRAGPSLPPPNSFVSHARIALRPFTCVVADPQHARFGEQICHRVPQAVRPRNARTRSGCASTSPDRRSRARHPGRAARCARQARRSSGAAGTAPEGAERGREHHENPSGWAGSWRPSSPLEWPNRNGLHGGPGVARGKWLTGTVREWLTGMAHGKLTRHAYPRPPAPTTGRVSAPTPSISMVTVSPAWICGQ